MIWTSAAATESYTLVSSCSLATTIYSTLIKMALLMILDSWMRKKMRCFASSVRMLQHHILVNDLLEAILHWSKLVIKKWSAHIWNDPVSQENAMAGFIPRPATVSSSSMVHGLLIIRSVFEKFRKACAVDSSFVSPMHTLFYVRWHVLCTDQWISKKPFWLSVVCTSASHKSYTWWKLFDTQTVEKI